MIINEEYKQQLQNKINEELKKINPNRIIVITAGEVIKKVKEFENFLRKIDRKTSNYEGTEVVFRRIAYKDEDVFSEMPCLNFKMKIENGQLHLIEFIPSKVSNKSKQFVVYMFADLNKRKDDFDFTYGERYGVKVWIYRSMARIRLNDLDADFDYHIDSFEDFYKMVGGNISGLNSVAQKNLLNKLKNYCEGELKRKQRKYKIQNNLNCF